jgi:hypothetical protein
MISDFYYYEKLKKKGNKKSMMKGRDKGKHTASETKMAGDKQM